MPRPRSPATPASTRGRSQDRHLLDCTSPIGTIVPSLPGPAWGILLLRFRYGLFRCLKPDLGMSAVAEGLGRRSPAPAKGESGFGLVGLSLSIREVHRSCYDVGSVLARRDLYVRHVSRISLV